MACNNGLKEWTAEAVLEKCHELWPDYSFLLNGKPGYRCSVEVECSIHGKSTFNFQGRSRQPKRPCIKCKVNHNIPTEKEWLDIANKKHNNRYEYLSSYQKGDNGEVTFKCPDHGVVEMTRRAHLKSKTGCSHCSKEAQNFSRSKGHFNWALIDRDKELASTPYTVYLCSCQDYLKVGLSTEGGLRRRWVELKRLSDLESFKTIYKGSLEECFELEQFILDESESYSPTTKFGGYTECFTNTNRSIIQ